MGAPTAVESDGTTDAERLPSTFGLKDVFTCINVLGGVFAIAFCIEGHLRWAAYSFLLGYIFGDALDGYVARLTNTGNKFGAHFDLAGDALTQCVVPGAMLYVAYRDISPVLGLALSATLIISGTIRQARGAVAPVTFPAAYVGMPRTVSAIIIISYLNSALAAHLPGWRWLGIPIVLFCAVAHLLPIPFRTHKGRRLKRWVRYAVGLFFGTTLAALVLMPAYVFDVTLFWLLGYSAVGWTELEPDERHEFFVRARAWALAVRSAR